MNYNRRVVVFTLVTTFILLSYSVISIVFPVPFPGIQNISIVSDVLQSRPNKTDTSSVVDKNGLYKDGPGQITLKNDTLSPRHMGVYNDPGTIVSFQDDITAPALPALMRKIYDIKQGKKSKVRIAWFGDSMIEGDLLTLTFRKKLQEFMGAYGVGFVPATSVTAGFRTTVTHKWKGEWKEESFKTDGPSAPLYLSGHLFYTSDGELIMKDNTVKDTNQVLEKCLICGHVDGTVDITVNGVTRQYVADKKINRLVLDSSRSHTIDVQVSNNKLPVYGIAMEPTSGVVVDNYSFRGITGLELGKLDSNFLKSLDTQNPYDLVVLEYGANLMFRPNDTDYSWYQKHIMPVVKMLRSALPNTEFLVISTADRAFKYGDTWQTAVGMNSLIKAQAQVAYQNRAAFFNMYASMGGFGTIVNWADSTPTLANKDYIHPNFKGAEILGSKIYDAFMKDYHKAIKM